MFFLSLTKFKMVKSLLVRFSPPDKKNPLSKFPIPLPLNAIWKTLFDKLTLLEFVDTKLAQPKINVDKVVVWRLGCRFKALCMDILVISSHENKACFIMKNIFDKK